MLGFLQTPKITSPVPKSFFMGMEFPLKFVLQVFNIFKDSNDEMLSEALVSK